ncbi:hypothetical protein PR001_g25362 [Phytophthora rubi]|uniref:CCHC-type domain-containing protein n=1 Tax=Phytophthora rubi TaxID=129364 RepID=A0A6A3I703_9STRA|nr:hypothetical protein PR001_g25362 [Phytophthora rubi]
MTLETDDGGLVTLDTEEIRPSTGNTPMGTGSGGTNASGPGNSGPSTGDQGTGGTTATTGTGGGDTVAGSGDRGQDQVRERSGHAGGSGSDRRGDDTGAVRGGGDAARAGAGMTNTGGAGRGRTPTLVDAGRTEANSWALDGAPARPIVVREKVKSLKLTKFKGLDDSMPMTMWLKTVRAEVRRQAATMGVIWNDKQLYHEVAAHFEGEAQRWFATVMESVAEVDENINTLAAMLQAKYMAQRTNPEVVDLLNARRQMRGERLVEYAQALREIGERGDISEDWLVNAFLKGMNSVEGATHVRGHRPQTLDEAVNLAVPHVGDYGEGYGVGLESAMARWDEQEALRGRGPLAATTRKSGDQEQSGLAGNFGTAVSGYGPMWGTAERPPRYDTEGRPVGAGKTGSHEWWKAIPPGFKLVPAGTTGIPAGQTSGSNFQTSGGREQYGGTRGKRQAENTAAAAKRPAKTFKVEGRYGNSTYGPGGGFPNPVLDTREGRMQNHERYMAQRQPRQPFVPRAGTECFYCGKGGHFARDCLLKKSDFEASAQNPTENNGEDEGNDQRA